MKNPNHIRLLCGAIVLLVNSPAAFAADPAPPPPPHAEKRVELRRLGGGPETRVHVIDGRDLPKEKVTFLGVETGRVSPTVAAQLGIPERTGLTVLRVVDDSPASGVLEQHDILTKFNDQILVNEGQLSVLVRAQKPGDEVSLTFLRGGKETKAKLKLAEKEMPKMAWRMEGFPHDLDLNGFQFEFNDKAAEWGERAKEWAERAKEMSGRVRADVERTLRVLRSDDDSGSHIFINEGGPMKRVTRINTSRGNIVFEDDSGYVEVKMTDAGRNLVVKDKDGKVLFDGPVNTDAERAALDEKVRERLTKVERMIDVDYTLDDKVETKETTVFPGRTGVSFEREAAPRPVRTYSL